MSVWNDSAGTIDDGRASLSSTFLEFCVKVRNNDPSILPEPGMLINIRGLGEKEHMELTDALLENTSVTYINVYAEDYTTCSAEAMATYVRTSKCWQHMRIPRISPSFRPRALARVAEFPDEIFEVLRSKPILVPSEDTGDKEATTEVPSEDTGCKEATTGVPSEDTRCIEAAKDTGIMKKRKRGDE
jgi:hypothetical protein